MQRTTKDVSFEWSQYRTSSYKRRGNTIQVSMQFRGHETMLP